MFGQTLSLHISGNNPYETKVLDSLDYRKKHENYVSIQNEIDLIQKTLFNIGYIENHIYPLKKNNDSTFSTQISLKTKYKAIHIYYERSQIDIKLLNSVSEKVFENYFIIDFIQLESTLNFINSKMIEKGFPFTKLKLSNIEIESRHNLKAYLNIETTNRKRNISKIIIKGYEKFPHSFLKYYLKIKPNQLFNLNEIKTKTKGLNNLRFASEIKPPEVLFSKDSTTLYVYLQKTASNTFDGFLGFGTNEDTNNLQFDGYLNLSLINNLNYGESFKLNYKSDENDQKTFETNLSLPYLLKSPIGIDLALRIFKQDSSFSTVNQSVKAHYQINTKHKIYSGILSTQSNNLLNENTSTTIFDYNTRYFSLGYQFLKNQNYNSLFPINTSILFETNIGTRYQTDQQENQSLMSFDGYKILNLDNKNSFYLRLNVANLNSKTYFENELLRFGGINSIRGFEENSIYATLFGLINTEYRYQLNNTLYIHSISDLGFFENELQNTEERLYTFGFGFGILTKTGLLKFNFANGKNENNSFKLANSKIHLSLIANF